MIRKKFYWFIFLILISISFIFLNIYSYNKLYFVFLSLLCNGYFLISFSKNIQLFHLFNSFFLWMGFWTKIILISFFFDLTFGELNEENNLIYSNYISNFDKAVIVSSVGILGFFLSSIINLFYFPLNYKQKKIFNDTQLINFFNNYQYVILFFFILLILIINYFNFYYLIYQKGLLANNDIPKLISITFKWLLLFGLSSFSVFIIYNSLSNNKISLKILIIAVFENFITSVSLLSRGMFVNFMAIFFSIIRYNQFIKLKNPYKPLISMLFVFVILFLSSLIIVQDLRKEFYFDKKIEVDSIKNKNLVENKNLNVEQNVIDIKETLNKTYQRYIRPIFYLISQRFVGFDAVLAVTEYEGKSLNFFLSSFTKQEMQDSYSRIIKNEDYVTTQSLKENTKFIKVPGIIAFLFYSGSLFFVFLMCLILGLIFTFFEKFVIKFSNGNLIFGSLMSQVLAYRLSNFGFMPQNSYLLILTVLFNLLLFYLIYLCFYKISNR